MRASTFFCLILLTSSCASSASPAFLLGADYSEWLPAYVTQIATDGSGALYILSQCATKSNTISNCVAKLSANGQTILWQYNLEFPLNFSSYVVQQMAVDPAGGVYVIPMSLPGDTSIYVAKLRTDGTGLAWKAPIGSIPPSDQSVLAVDSQGRAYVGCGTTVARLNAAGTAVDYSIQVAGAAAAIAVDGTGAAFVAGNGFLARLAPDGSAGFYSVPVSSDGVFLSLVAVAIDPNGNAVAYASDRYERGVLLRFDSTGAETLSETIPGNYARYFAGMALDADGNAYITGRPSGLNPVINSLATCGVNMMGVFAPDGSSLQVTYAPGGGWPGSGLIAPLVATGPDSTVFVVDSAGSNFAPTRAGPFPAGAFGAAFLWHLSANSNAQTVPLACLGSAATFATGPIAPGGFVTLFGNGLGPQQGVQTSATLQTPFPTQTAGVEVTFDGTPAPLLWVQNSQINLVAPWSLTPGQDTQVCVSYGSVKTNCLTWPVAQTAPAVFTVDGFYAAALNQDGSVNSAQNPAPSGSIVSVWATGLGPISPPQADGTLVGLPLPTNVLPLVVQAESEYFPPCIWGMFGCQQPISTYTNLDVTYAGPAPYLIDGASQINFRVVYDAEWFNLNLPSKISPGFQIHVTGQ